MSSRSSEKISLIIPAYNEDQRLGPFLATIETYVRRHPLEFREIMVVDDGSSDRTLAEAKKWARKIKLIKIIQHPTNKGKGAAIQTGVKAARGELIIFMDADGATPISEIPKLRRALQETDIAIGNRWLKGAKTERTSWLRKLSGWVYRTYMKLFGLGQFDTMCGFKGYRAPVAKQLFRNLINERWLFDTEVAYRARLRGYSVTNVPINWTSQDGSKLSTLTLLKSAWQILPLVQAVKQAEKKQN